MIFGIGRGVGEEEDPTGFVVTVLAAEVKRRETGPVDGVHIGLGSAQKGGRLGVAPPGRLVKSAIAVLKTTREKDDVQGQETQKEKVVRDSTAAIPTISK